MDWNRTLCDLLYTHTSVEFDHWTSALGQAFAFHTSDGYWIGGRVRTIEYEPDEFFRIWGDGELHVEWRPAGTCHVFRPLRYGGVEGTFSFASERRKELDVAA